MVLDESTQNEIPNVLENKNDQQQQKYLKLLQVLLDHFLG